MSLNKFKRDTLLDKQEKGEVVEKDEKVVKKVVNKVKEAVTSKKKKK